jgi:LPS sulfotransferase NodH
LAYWKARRLPISPVPGSTAIVRHVKSSAAITPPKTYYYQNPNQPETKTQRRKIQTMMKWKKQSSSRDVGLLKLVLQNQSDVKYCRTQNRILSQRLAEQRQKFLVKLQNRILSQRMSEQRQKFLANLQNRILSQRLGEQRPKFLAKLHVPSRDDILPRFSPPWVWIMGR